MQAWRAGTVLVANAFGTGVLESPALHAFLPAACERLLGEALDHAVARDRVVRRCRRAAEIARAVDGVIKPACPASSMEPVFLADVDAAAREAWAARLAADPDSFVVEEFLPLSHTPVWHDRALASRALMLRVFLVVGQPRPVPHDARRPGPDRRRRRRHIVSGQRGGGSKDTWMLSDSPVEAALPLEPRLPHRDGGRQTETVTSSRAAEHCSGWAATRSAARTARVSCVRCSHV